MLLFYLLHFTKIRHEPIFVLTLTSLFLLFSFNFIEAQVIPTKARGTTSGGPTLDQAQSEDAMGPKARVAVLRFEDKSAKGKSSGQIGDGMAEMLSNALFSTNRFIVLERGAIEDVKKELEFEASGYVKPETAARIGEIEGADLLIRGTITEFEPGSAGAGGGTRGVIPVPIPGRRPGVGIGGIGGGIRISHVALIVKVIDTKTSRLLASEQVEGKATDIGGITGMAGGGLAGVFGGYSKTPMEKAIRITIEEAVKLIVAKTPSEYFRESSGVKPKPTPTTSSSKQSTTGSSAPSSSQVKTSGSGPRIVYVSWQTASLREGPGTNFKILVEITKGTGLAVVEEKGPWFRVRLEDGREGWVGKATTSANP